MAGDGGSVSTVVSSICCVVQKQLAHFLMGQTPCNKGFVGINSDSVSISVTTK